MGKAILNGFSEKEIIQLYKYLCYYEDNLKKIKTNRALDNSQPRFFATFYKLIPDKSLTKGKQGNINKKPCPINTIRMTIGKTKMLAFLKHLRNSIAHSKIKKEENKVIIMDLNHNNLTAYGEFYSETIISLIKLFR